LATSLGGITNNYLESLIESFDREGFCVVKNMIGSEHVSLLKSFAEVSIVFADKIFEDSGKDRLGMHTKDKSYVFANPSNHFPQLNQVSFGVEMMTFVRNFLGPNSYLVHDQFTIKNPMTTKDLSDSRKLGYSTEYDFGWHQDRYEQESATHVHDPFITCLIPLHDMGDDNGGIRLVPFSNYNRSREAMPHVDGNVTEDVEKFGITVDCKVGDILFWTSNTLHSSRPNTSDANPRWVYIAQFSAIPLAMAGRNDCAMRSGQIIGENQNDISKPLLMGVNLNYV